jgi:hypothetical protein
MVQEWDDEDYYVPRDISGSGDPNIWTGQNTFTNTPYAIVVKGDKAVYDFKNSLGNDVLQIGTYEAWLGSGADNTDAAIGALASLFLFAGDNTTATLRINSAGALGIQGYGPTAAAFVDMTPDTGTFTATLTGCSTSPTGTAIWARHGNMVTLLIPLVTGTSTADTCAITGLPAVIQPIRTQMCAVGDMENATVLTGTYAASIANASGTITFYFNGSASGFTASGTKGFAAAQLIQYLLN